MACTTADRVRPRGGSVLALLALLIAGAGGAPAAGEPLAYVRCRVASTVSVIDLASQALVATIAVPEDPRGIAVAPDGREVYVSSLRGTVSVIDTQTLAVTARIDVGVDIGDIAVTADGRYAYVTAQGSANEVVVVDLQERAVQSTVLLNLNAERVVMRADTPLAYVMTIKPYQGTLVLVDTDLHMPFWEIPFKIRPAALEVSPDQRSVYLLAGDHASLAVVDTERTALADAIGLPYRGGRVRFSPDGAHAWVTHGSDGAISVVDTSTLSLGEAITTVANPVDVGFSADGAVAYVVDHAAAQVVVVDTETGEALAAIDVAQDPEQIAVALPLRSFPTHTPLPGGTPCELPPVPTAAPPAPTPTPSVPRQGARPLPACTGDCNGDARVSVDELLRGVRLALGDAGAADCVESFDRNGDGRVTVDELTTAVSRALDGCPAAATPRPTPAPGQGWVELTHSGLGSVDFVDRQIGWATTGAEILHTEDGGRNWFVQAQVDGFLDQIQFVDRHWGWTRNSRDLWRTEDGGGTWVRLPRPPLTRPIEEFEFVGPDRGWIATSGGEILRTDDGGESWVVQASRSAGGPIVGFAFVVDFAFVDRETGWALAHTDEADGHDSVLHTEDGGESWVRQSIPMVGVRPDLRKVKFIDRNVGWILVRADVPPQEGDPRFLVPQAAILRTTDGGQSWTHTATLPYLPTGIAFADAQHGWLIGETTLTIGRPLDKRAVIAHTCDGGFTWTEQPRVEDRPRGSERCTESCNAPTDIDAVDAQTAWVVGQAGLIVATTDSGAHWNVLRMGSPTPLNAVHFFDPSTGWAVGTASGESAVIGTTDGGRTWHAAANASNNGLYALTFTDPQHGWAVGGAWNFAEFTHEIRNTTVRTDTGGAQWGAFEYPENDKVFLYGVDFVDAELGWAVGGYEYWRPHEQFGRIYRSTDGGRHWEIQIPGQGAQAAGNPTVDAVLQDVVFLDADNGWVIGNRGTILSTSDGGTTWVQHDSPTEADLRALTFVTPERAWIVGTEGEKRGRILQSTDGGSSWRMVTIPEVPALLAVAFPDVEHGWAVGWSGTILRTTDGGQRWYRQESHGQEILSGISALDSSTAWVVGSAGTVLKTVDGGGSAVP